MTENNDPKAPQTGSIFDVKWNETDEMPTVTEYRTLSISGLLALLFGLFSPLVLVSWGFIFLPILAVILAFAALYVIEKSDGMKIGRPLAWMALFLSLCFVVLTFVLWENYKSRMVREAIQFGGIYFELLAHEKTDPEIDLLRVRDMRAPYWHRSKASLEDRWRAIDKDMMGQEDVGMTANDICLRTMLALGQNAKATFYKVDSYFYDKKQNLDYVTLIYAVTYSENIPSGDSDKAAEEKKTFFVKLTVKRFHREDTTTIANQKTKMGGWAVSDLSGPVLPEEFADGQ